MEGIEEHKKSRIRKKEQKVAQNNPYEQGDRCKSFYAYVQKGLCKVSEIMEHAVIYIHIHEHM